MTSRHYVAAALGGLLLGAGAGAVPEAPVEGCPVTCDDAGVCKRQCPPGQAAAAEAAPPPKAGPKPPLVGVQFPALIAPVKPARRQCQTWKYRAPLPRLSAQCRASPLGRGLYSVTCCR